MIKTGMGSALGEGVVRPSDEVSRLTHQRIRRYLDSREDPSLYQSTRNMSQIVADDYGNRFLVELIQNAHDAHDASRTDGEISIVLDASDGFGCLYVANRGAGFIGKNLKAITSVALSSKPVNAGAGNKGLGFRSVLQICHWPEIYSVQDAGNGTFNGYCFRFAQLDDLRAALPEEPPEFIEEMAHNLPFWHLPIPVEPSARVQAFAQQGFATVIRLPLKSADALVAVRTQFQALRDLRVPLHLFLDRVGAITLDDGVAERVVLDRSVQETWSLQPQGAQFETPITVSRLRLGTEEFVVGHWDVDEAPFRDALQASLGKSEVPESWGAWQGAARISVAVPLGAPLEAGRLYCFLPLGSEGRAPVGAYINANFYTKMDRRTVDTSIRLNDFFMRRSVWLSCQLIRFLVARGWPQAPTAVVSLLCWSDSYLETLKQAMLEGGKSILEGSFLPVLGAADAVTWASPLQTYSWTSSPDACLSPKAIADVAGGQVLVDSLAPHQRVALDCLSQRLRFHDFAPPPAVIAGWVEKIAEQLRADAAPPERWAAFYDEVAAALGRNPDALFGKKFLLSVGGELIVSELPLPSGSSGRARRAADVYFAPVLAVDAEVDDDDSKKALPLEQMPADLAKGFALLSRDVPWLKDDGGHRPGRSFLLAGKLAREYDTRDVLRTLAGVTRSAQDPAVRVQALEWAFRLWSSGRSLSANETRSAAFHVPTAAGWVGAEAAMFGSGWEALNAKKLHALLRTASETSEDLRRSLSHLLPDYAQWPVAYGAQVDWIQFLTAAGVVDCLRPIIDEVPSIAPASRAGMPAALAQLVPKFSEGMRMHWRELLSEDCARMYVSYTYRADLKAWRLPGQFDHESFPADVRRDYAVQVALAMRALTDDHLMFRVVRADAPGGTDRHSLSTPLLAFLTGAPWLPVSRPQFPMRFVKPSQAWCFRHDEERPPRFTDFLMQSVVDALDLASTERLRARGELGLFNDKRYAGRALTYLCEAATPGLSEIRDTRRFCELFSRVWQAARAEGTLVTGSVVPVISGGVIATVSGKGDAEGNELGTSYFDDEHDGLKKQVLKEMGKPVFDFVQGDSDAAWEWVSATAPGRFSRISDEPADVYVDGIQLDDETPKQLLTEAIGPWIVDFLVCIAEHKGGSFFLATQNTLNSVRRAACTLSVVIGREIRIAYGEHRAPLPSSVQGALALIRPEGAVLVVEAAGALTLDLLAKTSGQLAVALGSRPLANGLDAALLRLASTLRALDLRAPDDSIVASALGVEPAAIGHTRRLVSGDLIGMLKFAIPLSACCASAETTASLRELASQDDPADAELRVALEALATRLNLSLAQLEDRMLAVLDLPDLKAKFHLPIQQLNAVVDDLGAPYQPVSNEFKHKQAWTRYVNKQQPAILERLRARAVIGFDRQEPLSKYVQAREEVLAAPPDLAWFTTYDELPENVMDAQIAGWIDACMADATSELPLTSTLSETRTQNGDRLRRFWEMFSPLMSTWSTAQGTATTPEVRQCWMRTDGAREALFARARKGGWLDFRALDEDGIAAWLTLEGVWPVGRPVNSDPAAWGLTTSNLNSNEDRVKAERAAQQLRRTQVEFAGTTMSALSNGYAAIAAAVAGQSGSAPGLLNALSPEATLLTVDPSRPGGGSGGGGGAFGRSNEASMSDEQKMAVGLIGELWAREWLRRRHKLDSADENIWFSGYRDSVLNTVGGSDVLGYDFKVETPSITYYYEVKASFGDPRRFEMGPTEIFAAQRYRADGDNRYRILYIAYAGDPTRMIATLLNNPYSNKGAARFQAVGRGSVTYEFNVS
jgi:hypothetical protein